MATDDLAERGWTLEDFGYDRETYLKRNKPSDGFSPNYTSGVSGGGNQPPTPGVEKKLPPGYEVNVGKASKSAIDLGMVTPQQQAQVAEYLEDPGFFEQKVEQSKRFLGRLFDIEDEKETVVESAWDGFLTGVNWGYDRLNQVTAAGLSGLPGGVRTLTWDEANDVSVGQVAAANAALSKRQAEKDLTEGNILGAFYNMSNVGGIAGFAGLVDEETLGLDFDITDPAQRQAAFVDDPVGKWSSGLTDAVFAVFADPLIVGGKALKVARIRWVDQPVTSQKQVDALARNLDADNVKDIEIRKLQADSGPEAQSRIDAIESQMSAQGRFLRWVGEENRTYDEIYNHVVIKDASQRDLLAAMFKNADDFEDRALVMRVAYGDKTARELLNQKRSDLADAMGDDVRKKLAITFALHPDRVDRLSKFYVDKLNSLEKELKDITAAGGDEAAIAFARQQRDMYVDLVADIRNGKILRDPISSNVTPEDAKWARSVVRNYVKRDNYLRKAVEAEYETALQSGNKNFSANNIVGRSIERSRERRAIASAQMEGASVKSIWLNNDYTPLGRVGRTVRLWRWAGKEKPAGYITTRGTNIQEQYREIRANLNNLGIYSGNAVTRKVNGKDVVVGGSQRREELIQRYIDKIGTAVEDQDKMAKAINALEDQIVRDIGAYHNMSKEAADKLLSITQRKRQELIKEIRNRGFYVEDGVLNKVPFLESQLQNGTYLLQFRALEKAVAKANKDGMMRQLNEMASIGGEKLVNFYDFFNSLWRPSVLLRFGYTQRNYVEGAFRAVAFSSSLAPLVYTGKAVGFGFRNMYTKQAVAREAARVQKGMGGKKFRKWRATQEAAIATRIENETKWVNDARKMLDDMDKADPEYSVNKANIDLIEAQIADNTNTLELLNNDITALSLYKARGADKRRVFDGEYENPNDPLIRYKAFGNPNFTDLAWANMSSNATTRSTLSLRLNTDNSLFFHKINKTYVDVTPEQGDAYFEGVAEMLKQFRQSEVGQRLMRGDSPESIAVYLRTTEEGKSIVKFLNGAFSKKEKGILDAPIKTYDDAFDYVLKVQNRIDELLPNPAARKLLANDRAIFAKTLPQDLKRLLDTDEYRDMLIPAIGNIAQETMSKKVRETINEVTKRAFNLLGTIPEDALVRGPFYGRRYNETRELLMRQLDEQYKGKTVPFAEIRRRERLAHYRALKDTKDWIYTIERRTNLGHYGEFLIPFISAMQNSVTALGKLTWRDPSIIGVVNLLWQAPARGGMEDEKGNIVIPLPESMIPEGVAAAVGIDNMRNMKINKASLNVIFPETGYGFAPRPGPLVAVPASEIMKRGFFGASVETPTVLTEAFGEEAGNELWEQWRKYIFGEEDGLSAESLSWDMWTAPAIAKIVQMMQGEGGSTSYAYMYNLQYRTEMAKVFAGERDFPDTEEEFRNEIQNRTRGMFLLRALANLTAFTPPQYESKLEPLIDTIRKYEQDYDDGLRRFNEDYGDLLLMLGDFKVSQNVAGVQANVAAVKNARRYENIIRNVSAGIEDDLSVLGILLNEDPNGLYDNSAYAWQRATKIPGINKTYREIQTPEQAMIESSKNAGWTQFISFTDQMDAILQQRGLDSYRSSKAADLRNYKKQYIAKLRTNPLYEGWYQDYINFGSTRTISAVKLMEAALRDEQFVEDHEDDPKWQSAAQYLELRRDVVALVEASGAGINAERNRQVRDLWDRGRQRLKMQSTQWSSIANRYLNGDDDPTNPGVTLGEVLAGEQEDAA